MTVDQLFGLLAEREIALSVDGEELVVRGDERAIDDSTLSLLRENKQALLEALRSRSSAIPPNLIPDQCEAITPEMLTLVDLTPVEIERVVGDVPGGAGNIQDVYPLAPLQEGFLFHHLRSTEGDPYLVSRLFRFDTRARLDAYLAALQSVVDRHDILRTSLVWDGLSAPVQVVWRHAHLPVEEVVLDPAEGEVGDQLYRRFDPRRHRMDIRQAPWLRVFIAADTSNGRWLLLLVAHHLGGDHSAGDLLQTEIQAHLQGRQEQLPAPMPFRNFVAQVRHGMDERGHEAYFRQLLGDVDEPTAPFGMLEVGGDGTGIAEEGIALERELVRRLRDAARRAGVSAASVFHLAYALMLGRVSGREDVVFGTVLFGRVGGGIDAERVFGLFINTLPVRIDVGRESVRESVWRMHVQLAELLRHEHASLAMAQRCSAVVPPMPLLTALINYRRNEATQEESGASDGIEQLYGEERTNYPLGLSVDEFQDGFYLAAQVPESIGPLRVCRLMQTAVERVVEALETAPDRALSSLQVLPAAERRQVVEEWNDTAADFPRESCIQELFEQQVAATPHATALVHDRGQLTYAELNTHANQLAHHLLALGVRPDTLVGICVERGPDMIVGLLAVLKAGGAFVPLDPAYPAERLSYMVQDSAPAVVLLQCKREIAWRSVVNALPASVPVLDLAVGTPDWSDRPTTNPDQAAVGLRPEHLAYVIYTSGSTGRPKGVMVEHRGLCNLAMAQVRAFGITPQSRVLQFSSFSFDGCVAEVVHTLCGGAALVLPGAGSILAGDALLEVVRRQRITHATLPPAVLAALPAEASLDPLHTLIVAGDRLTEPVARRWGHGRRLINAYGPTEGTVCATVHSWDEGEAGDPSIGRPIENVRVYVLDREGRPVPAGVTGELHVGGVGVARGYLNRPELTAEKFVDDPFHGGRMYRTGDLGRHRKDGTIEFLGRNDFQVKIRGFRIELGEIEAQLLEHVREAVVLAQDDGTGDKQLVAYCVTDGELDAETLRQQLSAKLPAHLVPAAYVRLDAIPLTPNGKLDRKALPQPDSGAYKARAFEAPVSETEVVLAEIWAGLLRRRPIGRHDNFFELGGHSLSAVQVVSRLRQILNVEVAVSELFAKPVLADFARSVVATTQESLPAITPGDPDERLVLSFAQQRLWFLAQLEGMNEIYNLSFGLRLLGALDRDALQQALDRLVERHEILRTTFVSVDGEPRQRIAAAAESAFLLVEHDLREHADPEGECQRLANEEATARFDLEQGPLIRGHLVRLGEEEHALLITQHHIVSDGWSMGIVARELGALYAAAVAGQPDPLPPLELQYADYAAWQRRSTEGELLERQSSWWEEALAGAPALLELPADRPRPARQDFTGAKLELELDAELTRRIRTLSQRHGTTLFMILAASWAAILSRLSGQDDIVLGTPTANRGRSEIENLIGFFVNTLALRIDLSGSPTVGELLQRVRNAAIGAQQNQDIPFERVVELARPVRSLSHSPLFQAMFAWQSAQNDVFELPGVKILPSEGTEQVAARFDLSIELGEAGDAISGVLVYASALFDRDTVQRYVRHWHTLLEAMVANENEPVDRLSVLDSADRSEALDRWNATAAVYPAESCIHELFEAQVARTPDAPAVQDETRALTYAELNARANQLAHALRELGVRPDSRVAVCAERSVEMVVALLAVLKAGGAYVPLDPAYPPERLATMLRDSEPAAILTHAPVAELLGDFVRTLPVLDLLDASPAWSTQPRSNPDRRDVSLTSRHLAYVIYTSGSTGRPKGVMNEHRGVVNRLVWMQNVYQLRTEDAVLQKTPFSFDVSVWEFFWPLLAGARLVMARPGGHKDPGYLVDTIRRENITTIHFVPSMLQAFLEHERVEECSTLERIVCSGEALSGALAERLLQRLPGVRLYNLYGPTEAAVDVTAWTCVPGMEKASVPIGHPIANTRMYVLDPYKQPVPIGVTGELYIGGVQVARGYWNQPELTAEKFVDDPYASGAPSDIDGRMYRTGDLGRRLADGTLEFLGRTDFQVKIRGFRIELGEIEARLLAQPGVREALVLAREDTPGDKRLVAYLVADVDAPDTEQLRRALSAQLPEYMVPAAYVCLASLPLTPNGKVDRKALPMPGMDAYSAEAYEAPLGETETILAEIWAELLRVERVGRRDNFFELGGHSLLAVTLIERMRRRGLKTELGGVFSTPTIAGLAETALTEISTIEVPPNRIPLHCDVITPEMLPLVSLTPAEIARVVDGVTGGAANVQDIYPLAPLQEGILFHHLMAKEGDPYLLSSTFSFDSRARLDRYLEALQSVIDRHDILRTSVAWEGLPEPVQVVWRSARLSVREVVLEPSSADAAEQLRKHFDPRQYRMNVGRAPLIHAFIAHDAARSRWLLLLLNHHLVDDATSLGFLFSEVGTHLAGQAHDLPAPLPFRNFVAQARLGVSQQEHEAFFQRMLGDVDEPTAAFGLLDVQGDGLGVRQASVELDLGVAMRLRERARRLRVSPAAVFHLAWAQVLARAAGREDVVFGTVFFGRMHGGSASDRVLGLFINTLPLRIEVGGESVEVSVRRTHVLLGDLLRHEHASLALAQRCSAVPAPAPLFSALLNCRRHGAAEANDVSSSQWEGIDSLQVEERTNYPLVMTVDDLDQGFGLTAQTQGAVDPARICDLFVTALDGLIDALESAPETAVSRVDVLPQRERDLIVRDWNETWAAYPRDLCVHQLFEAQAEKTPDAIAVVHGERSVSYGRLNASANRLAYHLIALGVGPDVRVAICVERGIEMMVGLLAVLKAGGAYVPLDPAYPIDRLEYMLEDSEPMVVLAPRGTKSVAPVLDLILDEPLWVDQPEHDPARHGVTPDHLAYVIYTSGSSGRPKGVMNHHRGVMNLLWSMLDTLAMQPSDNLLALTTLSFDIAALELYLPLICGATVTLSDRSQAADAQQLATLIESSGATVIQATPATWRMLVESGWHGARGIKALCGGEALPVDLAMRVRERVGTLWNVYGPTETTIWSSLSRFDGSAPGPYVSIGRPLANTRMYLLDSQERPVPIGVTGELYIGGDGVARGYLNRPELTAEKFLDDPFSPDAGARMYRTGDLARWLADGSIEFLGRNDFQVKVRGFRIELGEIEARLAEHPSVRETVVVARDDGAGEKRLVAYVVPRNDVRTDDTTTFSLFYFGADTDAPENKYQLYLDAARFADAHGFEAIWTPERHFDHVGGLYPNPSLLNAALAVITENVKLRAGSVVLPLHNPVRVAEEWAVVDNLSRGRVGIAIATGWHPRDFVLAPDRYTDRRQIARDEIAILQALWAGQTVTLTDGTGNPSDVRIYPQPVQTELPLWITVAGGPEGFRFAGRIGANVLTHLLGQTMEQAAENIALYRAARAESGHDPQAGRVTMMVHTFVGDDPGTVLQQAKAPFMNYMRAHLGLLAPLIRSLDVTFDELSEQDRDSIFEFAFERYSKTASLIGTPESCLAVVRQLKDSGVDEIACLIDWMDAQQALSALEPLRRLRDLSLAGRPSVQALRRHCAAGLPDHMVPRAMVFLDELPRTPNGKLDRRAFPAPEAGAYGVQGYEAPEGEREIAVAEIWAAVLWIEKVGRSDNFFDLGGHSLSAVQVISRLRQALGREVALNALFSHPVLSDFALATESATQAVLPPIVRAEPDDRRFLSFAQRRLWFLAQFDPAGTAYHEAMSLRLSGSLDADALHYALDRLIGRHEVLRTTFVSIDGEPMQCIAAPEEAAFRLEEHDIRGQVDVDGDLERLATLEAEIPFDLEYGPLIRGRLIRQEDDEHTLLITQHHIVSDGWSMGVMLRELGVLYAAYRAGEPDPLPPLAVQYADYAAWQRRWMDGGALQKQADYWKSALTGVPMLLELPADRPRPKEQDFSGARVPIQLDAKLTRELKALSQRHGTTLFTTLVAMWAAVLARLSNQGEVVIGAPSANRGHTETEGLIGFFINTLALRIDLSDAPAIGKLLERAKVQSLAAQQNQDIPFEQIVELLQPARSMAHTPLFQVMATWQNMPEGSLEFPGIVLTPGIGSAQSAAKFDLSLSLRDTGEHIAGELEYATALFDRGTIERFVGHWRTFMESCVLDDRQTVDRVPLLTVEERTEILDHWRSTTVEPPIGRFLHEWFEFHASRTPDAVALVQEHHRATYGEVNARANQLAHHLLERGVRPDDRVVIATERGIEAVSWLLGVLKAGAAYVPLDPAWPAERIANIIEDCQPALVLDAETDAHAWAAQPRMNPDPDAIGLKPGDLAYVIYTSGSTGTPKGVMVEHRSIVNHMEWMLDRFPLRANDAVVQKTPSSFDASVWELFAPLLTGGRLVLARQDGHRDPDYLVELLQRESVHTLQVVPTQLAMLLRTPAFERCTSLRRVFCGGETLPAALVDELFEKLPHVQLVNLYGPTEATIDATYWVCRPRAGERIPIGRPLANTLIYILDPHGQPVPAGVTGEIHIGGVSVARGYLNRPGLTAERFVPDPFRPELEMRMFRTGDLGRLLADGAIEFRGRNDFQVKIRGFRIEPGEIESRLAEHPAIRQAVVLAREDMRGDLRLVAYLVADRDTQESAVSTEELRRHLIAFLPDHMVPAAYVRLESLPLTSSGKVDRNALPPPDGDAYAKREYVAPLGETEAQLAGLWADLLKADRVGRHDNFFELGGHSLLAVTMVERMRRLGLRSDVRAIFTNPTVASFAAALADAAPAVEVPANLILEPVSHDTDDTSLRVLTL